MLYLVLLVYLVAGFFFPIVGWAALVCMVAPVWMSIYRGRFWCGHFCPRGNLYDRVISRISPHRRIPSFMRSVYFRSFMVAFIFTMFGVQMYWAWGDLGAMGSVFWLIILITTIVGVLLSVVFAPRTWCSFCPMGTLSAWVAPRNSDKRISFENIHIDSSCVLCKKCAKVCPMQLMPYEAKNNIEGMADTDCIKCGVCVEKCPKKSMVMK